MVIVVGCTSFDVGHRTAAATRRAGAPACELQAGCGRANHHRLTTMPGVLAQGTGRLHCNSRGKMRPGVSKPMNFGIGYRV